MISESTYHLVGLDTNVISQILRDPHGARKGFFSLFADGHHVPCFTVYSTFELRPRVEIYEQFVEFFDVFPCALLMNEEMLFDAERAMYPDSAGLDPTIIGFSPLNEKHGTNLRNIMDITFSKSNIIQREQEWPDLKKALLNDWVTLSQNFHPKGRNFTPSDGKRFVKELTKQHVADRAQDWIYTMHKTGRILSYEAFPSLQMTFWTLFFRFYMMQREPETQDVFDVLNSAPAPYLDAVVTENFQADIYQQIKKLDPALLHLDIFTLRDLKAHA